ncbi:MAG: hypothetical protein B7Y80_20845 [Hyphomicrobium sp. 32-62-53]|nr:MAG: hypothetical protein B7Z29_20800 [Hyphomicrobium sp. 12-62-95]OYX97108.1 MAG: hypothetical protein B7Y80_20845 [Hyphomicrobium sp. 32-62-53]
MDPITKYVHDYHSKLFQEHGATPRGVDWRDEIEMYVRYDKMLTVLDKDFKTFDEPASLLDVGCGWGGLYRRAEQLKLPILYTGADVVESMVDFGRKEFPNATFIQQNVLDLDTEGAYDFVVGNGIFTQKLDLSIQDMEKYVRRMVRKMFQLCRHGVAFNMISTRVNFILLQCLHSNVTCATR